MRHLLVVVAHLCAVLLPSAVVADDVGLVLVADPAPALGVEGRLRAIVIGTSPVSGSEVRVRAADEIGGGRMVELLEGSAARRAAIPAPVLPKGGAVRFESLTLPSTPVGPPSTAGASQTPAEIAFSVHVAEPPATEVAVTAVVRAPGGAEVQRFDDVVPIGPASGPGNAVKRLANGAFTWSFTSSDGTDDDAKLPPGLYAVELEARARKRLFGLPLAVGNVARASGTLLVSPGAGGELLAVAEWSVRPSAEGLYPVTVALVDGERVRTGDVRYLLVRAGGGALLPYEAAYTLQFARHLDHVRSRVPAGETPSDSMLIPVVSGDAGSTFGTSLEEDDLAAPFTTVTASSPGTTLRLNLPSRSASGTGRIIEGDLKASLSPFGDVVGPQAIGGIRVCIYEADPILDDLVNCTHTDDAGHYRMTFDSDMGDGLFGGGPEFFLQFEPADYSFEVRPPKGFLMVATVAAWNLEMGLDEVLEAEWRMWTRCGGIYCWRSTVSSIPGGDAPVVFNRTFTADWRVNTFNELAAPVMVVALETHRAQQAQLAAGGSQGPREDTGVYYPGALSIFGSFFVPFAAEEIVWDFVTSDFWGLMNDGEGWAIEIQAYAPFDRPSTMRHEYGHSVQYSTLGTLPIFAPLGTRLDPTVLAKCLVHQVDERESRACALTEGFAEYWQVRTDPARDGYDDNVNWETFDTQGLGAPDEGGKYEGNVAAWLWDLEDEHDDIRYYDATDAGDLNAGVTIAAEVVLMAMRSANMAGHSHDLGTAGELWGAMTGAWNGLPRRVTPGQEYFGARAGQHNWIPLPMPPGPQPTGERADPLPPGGNAIDPIAAIYPPRGFRPLLAHPSLELACDDGCGFGHTLVRADVNGDGREDLLIGAPGLAWYERDAKGFIVPASRTAAGGFLAYLGGAGGTYARSNGDSFWAPPALGADGKLDPLASLHPLGPGLAVGDMDGSGILDDVALSTYRALPARVVLRVRAGGSGAERTLTATFDGVQYTPDELSVLDVNGDGVGDVLAHGYVQAGPLWDEAVLVWFGPFAGDRTAADVLLQPRTEPTLSTTPPFARGLALVDVDGDGARDLVVGGAGADGPGGANLVTGGIFRGPISAPTGSVVTPTWPTAPVAMPYAVEGMGAIAVSSIPGVSFGVAGVRFADGPAWTLGLYGPGGLTGTVHATSTFPATSATGSRPSSRQLRARDVTGLGAPLSIALGSGWSDGEWQTSLDVAHLEADGAGGVTLSTVVVPAPSPGQLFGYDAAALADRTGDGTLDLAASAPLQGLSCFDGSSCPTGAIFVFSGADVR